MGTATLIVGVDGGCSPKRRTGVMYGGPVIKIVMITDSRVY